MEALLSINVEPGTEQVQRDQQTQDGSILEVLLNINVALIATVLKQLPTLNCALFQYQTNVWLELHNIKPEATPTKIIFTEK